MEMPPQVLSQGMIPSSPSTQSSGVGGMTQVMSGNGLIQGFSYDPPAGVWDEMMDRTGAVRPHWVKFLNSLARMGAPGLSSQSQTVERLLRDHGATYNVYHDAGAVGRPWTTDALPSLLAPQDFTRLESALQQRIRLFRAILADAYGPQQMLHKGWIPPRLLFANPGYLRPVGDVHTQDGFIFLMATDLVRSPDGAWQALSDRAQMPGGLGYSLENRIVLSQVFSRDMKHCKVQRLAEFFERVRDGWRELASPSRQAPNIVIVTPGPQHRGYFEHAFKARYLGFPLVEGADLTVRDRRLFLKTLEGLRQVDVLVRRVDDYECDSLELNSTAGTGIPGLLEAWRCGRVSLANGIGTGLLEAPAWLPFLSGLCRNLLGEELALPSVPTWWCGQRKEMEMVLADPRRWVFKRAYLNSYRLNSYRPAQLAARMNDTELAKLTSEIRSHPESWVAQEAQTLSTTPVLINGSLEPRSLVLRCFTMGTSRSCHVMPGGLGRVATDKEGFLVTMHAGARSKDVWVLSNDEVPFKSLIGERPEVLRVARPPGEVPSRVADHLYWLGRYAERLEQTSRMLRMLCQRLTGEGGEEQARELTLGLRLAREVKLLDPKFDMNGGFNLIHEEFCQLLENPARQGGVTDLLARLRQNAAAARDRLSDDTWRLFNRLSETTTDTPARSEPAALIARLDRLILDMAAFSGMQLENMVQGHGWRFLEIGRRLERGWANTLFNRGSIIICGEDNAVLRPMLEVFDSTMTYRRHHLARPKLLFVLDLLMLNAANPRSLHYQLAAIHRQVVLLPEGSSGDHGAKVRVELENLLARTTHIDLKKLSDSPDSRRHLADFCTEVHDKLEMLSDQLTEEFFSHTMRQAR